MSLANILRPHTTLTDLAALLMRLTYAGTMMLNHGYSKLTDPRFTAATFPDPLGIGHGPSYYGAVGGEFFCSLLLVLGLFSRVACLPFIFTMGVAFFVVHRADPFQVKELAMVYMAAGVIMLLLGPGKYSLDHALFCKKHGALTKGH